MFVLLGDLLRSLYSIDVSFVFSRSQFPSPSALFRFLCHECVCMSFIAIASMKNCGWDDRVLFESINSLTNPAHDRCGKKRVLLSFPSVHLLACLLVLSLVSSVHAIFCCSVPIHPPPLVRVSFSFSNSSVMFFVEWFSQFI